MWCNISGEATGEIWNWQLSCSSFYRRSSTIRWGREFRYRTHLRSRTRKAASQTSGQHRPCRRSSGRDWCSSVLASLSRNTIYCSHSTAAKLSIRHQQVRLGRFRDEWNVFTVLCSGQVLVLIINITSAEWLLPPVLHGEHKGDCGKTYLTSFLFGRHGRVTRWKSGLNFISSASFVLLVHNVFRQMHLTNLSGSIEAKYWVSWKSLNGK